ncbi:MAG: zinc ribbon domain-containing protein, partial [Thermoplasmata archaeon]
EGDRYVPGAARGPGSGSAGTRRLRDDQRVPGAFCPSCSKVISSESGTCPECWTDLSLYVICPSCSMLSPAGEKLCRECFAPLGEVEEPESGGTDLEIDEIITAGLEGPEDVVITEELREEMTLIETQEEQGKECLVCGAIFGPDDQLCPICGIEYGVEVEEPEVPEIEWDVLEVEAQPTIRTCPNCGKNVVGLDATDREINEGKWFYRGLITIFIGIFFTSFSIWARGISVENSSLGLNPPPTDVVLNLLGWILVLMGFVFWFLSWRLHGQRTECPECGIETEPNMEMCINCGVELIPPEEDEETAEEEEEVQENLLPEEEEDTGYLDKLDLPARRHADMPVRKREAPAPVEPEPIEEPVPDLEIPEEPAAEPEILEEPATEPEAAAAPEIHSHGEELPVEHEEHKKCPGCGIFVDLNDRICPVCDTEFAPEPEVDVLSEDEELARLGDDEIVAEPTIDDITVPDSSAPHVECPSCGADLEAGTKQCPVCEYPLE